MKVGDIVFPKESARDEYIYTTRDNNYVGIVIGVYDEQIKIRRYNSRRSDEWWVSKKYFLEVKND